MHSCPGRAISPLCLSRSRPIFRSFAARSRRSGGTGLARLRGRLAGAAGTRAARRALAARFDTSSDRDRRRCLVEGAGHVRGKSVSAVDQGRADRKPQAARRLAAQAALTSPSLRDSAARLRSTFCSRAAARGARPSRWRSASSAQECSPIDLSLASLGYAKRKTQRTRPRKHRIRPGRHLTRRSTRQVVRPHRVRAAYCIISMIHGRAGGPCFRRYDRAVSCASDSTASLAGRA